jgi:hypothetical protein
VARNAHAASVAPTRSSGQRLAPAVAGLRDLIVKLDQLLTSEGIDVSGYLTYALLVNVVRASRQAEGIVVLLDQPHPLGDVALILARSIWEILVTTDYILLDPDPKRREYLAHRYLSHGFTSTYVSVQSMTPAQKRAAGITATQVTHVKENHRKLRKYLIERLMKSGTTKADATKEADREINEWGRHRDWNGMSIKETTAAVGRADEYAQTYAFLSQYTHPGSEATRDYLTVSEGKIGLASDPDVERRSAMIACFVTARRLLELYEDVGPALGKPSWVNRAQDLRNERGDIWGAPSVAGVR